MDDTRKAQPHSSSFKTHFDMEQPMLSVGQPKGPSCDKATPNVLPCRIQHDGPISEADSYWKPSQESGICVLAFLEGTDC